jgi:hypothetical protein
VRVQFASHSDSDFDLIFQLFHFPFFLTMTKPSLPPSSRLNPASPRRSSSSCGRFLICLGIAICLKAFVAFQSAASRKQQAGGLSSLSSNKRTGKKNDQASDSKSKDENNSTESSSEDTEPVESVGRGSGDFARGPLPRDIQPTVGRWNNVALNTCIAQGAPNKPEVESWEKRAPHFIVLGHHKSGTQALTQYLWQHPLIVQGAMELHFFNGKAPLTFTDHKGVRRRDGRVMYQKALMKKVPADLSPPFDSNDSKMVTFDTTPRYFLDADRDPAMMMCLVPWVKLVVLFRDPVERVLSHYNYLNQARHRNNKKMVDWRDWINDDLHALRLAGVIDDDRGPKERKAFAGSEEEVEAWAKYTRSRNSQFLLGRGLYAIQLRQWFAAMEKVGKNRSDLHVIRSENLKANTQGEYNKLLDFLGLDAHQLENSGSFHETKETGYEHVPMPDDIRRELQEFFAPYNKQVYALLGGEEWDGVWDVK